MPAGKPVVQAPPDPRRLHDGEHSLRYALVVMQAAGIWGGLHYWLAGRHLAAARP